jgi:hypothetical protein
VYQVPRTAAGWPSRAAWLGIGAKEFAPMGFALRDSRRHTYADYLGWGEEQRYELIAGLAY